MKKCLPWLCLAVILLHHVSLPRPVSAEFKTYAFSGALDPHSPLIRELIPGVDDSTFSGTLTVDSSLPLAVFRWRGPVPGRLLPQRHLKV